jgi:hypothetical protein
MKRIFTLLLVCGSYLAISQPTIQSNWFPNVGNVFTSADIDATTLTEGSAGANQTWNYGNVVPQDISQYTIVDPASTPFASSFPGANRSMTISDGGVAVYTYHNHTTTSTDLTGFAFSDSASGIDLIMPYSDPQKQFEYPMTYNTQFTDNFAGSYTMVISGFTINSYRYGTIYVHADAYGSLTTPSGTFNNTLRIKTRQVTTDSTVFVGFPSPPSVSKSYITSYAWVGDNPGHIGLFQLSYDTIVDDQGTTYGKDGSYQLTTVSVNEINLRAENVNIYPNPVHDFVHVDASLLEAGEAILKVFDSSGRLVKYQSIHVASGEKSTILLSTDEFRQGFYQMNITQKDRLLRAKFIKH